jgi:hypothetical protein
MVRTRQKRPVAVTVIAEMHFSADLTFEEIALHFDMSTHADRARPDNGSCVTTPGTVALNPI